MPQVKAKINPKNKSVEPFDRMLRRFKKQVERAGIIEEVRKREYYVKPNQKRHKRNQDITRKKKIEARRAKQNDSRRRWGPLG